MILRKFKGGFWAGDLEILECLLVGEGTKEEDVTMRKNTFQAEENSEGSVMGQKHTRKMIREGGLDLLAGSQKCDKLRVQHLWILL